MPPPSAVDKEYDRLKIELRKAVQEGKHEVAIDLARQIINSGKRAPEEFLRPILEAVAATPRATKVLFSAMECCVAGGIHLDPQEYARILGRLLSRGACIAATRAMLNLALPPGMPPIPLVPEGTDEAGYRAAFEEIGGAPAQLREDLGDAENDDLQEDAAVEDGGANDSVEHSDDYRGVLELCNCRAQPELNGEYSPRDPMFDVLGHDRAIYVKAAGLALANGSDTEICDSLEFFAYYVESDDDRTWRNGWYLGLAVGGNDWVAYNPSDARLPPHRGWQVVAEDGRRRPDPATFVPVGRQPGTKNGQVAAAQLPSTGGCEELAHKQGEANEELPTLDVTRLRGLLSSRRPGVAAYFGHFVSLLHLERLAELESFRRRFARHSADRLVRFGSALDGLQIAGTFGRREHRKATLPGWPDGGMEFVAFRMPWTADVDRLRFKKGEAVIVSRSDPLKDAIGEGVVDSVDRKKLVVNLSATLPKDARTSTWRVDAYANRVVYERQMQALVQLATSERNDPGSLVREILLSAEVGKLDTWAEHFAGKTVLPRQKDTISQNLEEENQLKDYSCSSPAPVHVYKEKIVAIYSEHNPSKVADVDRLLDKYGDKPHVLYVAICVKYHLGPEPDLLPPGQTAEGQGGEALPSVAKPGAEQESNGHERNRMVTLAQEDPIADGSHSAAGARRETIWEVVKGASDLNESQRLAVVDSVVRRCSIVQGPPGTGKTHVSVKVLQMWIKTFGLSPVLATSDSNVAVDNIAEGLHRAGIKAVRLGRPEKFREHLDEIALDTIMARKKEQAKAVAEAIATARKQELAAEKVGAGVWEAPTDSVEEVVKPDTKVEENEQEKASMHKKDQKTVTDMMAESMAEHRDKQKQRQEDMKVRKEILQGAEVICVTTMSAGGDILRDFNFQAVLIDEVAQATELSTIVPIVLRGARQLVLVGDHCQLPPSVVSQEAQLRGLSLSLYQRLANSGLEPCFLDTQYRSHPVLAEFSARLFYQNALKSGVSASSRPLPRGVPWPNANVPVAFFEVGSPEAVEGESKANMQEVNHIVALFQEVLRVGELGVEDIGVVTPYMGQVRALRRALRQVLPEEQRRLLEIATVDNFQGREKELILFSAVRSNRHGNVGFLADWRRLNVMLTRARRGLVVFGTAHTLRYDCHWQQWLEWCHGLGAIGSTPSLATTLGSNMPKKGTRRGVGGRRQVWDQMLAEAPQPPAPPSQARFDPYSSWARSITGNSPASSSRAPPPPPMPPRMLVGGAGPSQRPQRRPAGKPSAAPSMAPVLAAPRTPPSGPPPLKRARATAKAQLVAGGPVLQPTAKSRSVAIAPWERVQTSGRTTSNRPSTGQSPASWVYEQDPVSDENAEEDVAEFEQDQGTECEDAEEEAEEEDHELDEGAWEQEWELEVEYEEDGVEDEAEKDVEKEPIPSDAGVEGDRLWSLLADHSGGKAEDSRTSPKQSDDEEDEEKKEDVAAVRLARPLPARAKAAPWVPVARRQVSADRQVTIASASATRGPRAPAAPPPPWAHDEYDEDDCDEDAGGVETKGAEVDEHEDEDWSGQDEELPPWKQQKTTGGGQAGSSTPHGSSLRGTAKAAAKVVAKASAPRRPHRPAARR